MSVLGIKSVPLERSTNVSWKTVPGFFFVDRARSSHSVERHVATRRYSAVINLGRVDCDLSGSISLVFNTPATIRAISTPKALRKTLNDFIAPVSMDGGPHWHKTKGYGGEGKVFHDEGDEGCHYWNDMGWDRQEHIEGTEYRIITVGDRVVQASRKGERRTALNGRNDFEYTWIGVEGIRQGGFIPLLKEAIGKVPGGGFSVFGWDVLHDGTRPYIIECNTSPGVNDATAARIINEVRRIA
jgi:hypothetical protein